MLKTLARRLVGPAYCDIRRLIWEHGSRGPVYLVVPISLSSTSQICHRGLHLSLPLDSKKKTQKQAKKKTKGIESHEQEQEEQLPDAVEELVDLEDLGTAFSDLILDQRQEYAGKLALRTSVSSFNNLSVSVENKDFPLQYLAQISQKGPNSVVLNLASNPQHVSAVRDALTKSSMNINPRIDGNTIYIELPKVTGENRQKMAKLAKEICDRTKERIRNVQNHSIKMIKSAASSYSKDSIRQHEKNILLLAQKYHKTAEETMKKKQNELLGS